MIAHSLSMTDRALEGTARQPIAALARHPRTAPAFGSCGHAAWLRPQIALLLRLTLRHLLLFRVVRAAPAGRSTAVPGMRLWDGPPTEMISP